jgi:hypothetical protein
MRFAVSIPVPFLNHNWAADRRREVFSKWWKLSEHKNIESELMINPLVLFDFSLHFRPSVKWHDHAGVTFDVGLLGLWFNFTFYDNRHALAYNEDEVDTDD